MTEQVCAACRGDNPECPVCGGSGVDRPEPQDEIRRLLFSQETRDSFEASDIVDVTEILDRIEHLFEDHNRMFHDRLRAIRLGLRAWFYGSVLVGGVLMLFGIFTAFLLGFYEFYPTYGMGALTVMVVAGVLFVAYRVQNYDVEDFLSDDDSEETGQV